MTDQSPNSLDGNPKRSATASIAGYQYQLWRSVLAWLELHSESALFLEGAEDFDIVHSDPTILSTAAQIKHRSGTFSLATLEATDALENFLEIAERNPSKSIVYRFLTTSRATIETDEPFGVGISGVAAWRACAETTADQCSKIVEVTRALLRTRAGPRLKSLLETTSPEELHRQLIQRVHWGTGEPRQAAIIDEVQSQLGPLLEAEGAPPGHAALVADVLLSYVSRLASETRNPRRLMRTDLLRQVELATRVPRRDFEALRTSRESSTSRPEQSRSFPQPPIPDHGGLLGREDELKDLTSSIAVHPLTLVVGLRGIGKSCLVSTVARSAREGRPVIWADVAQRVPELALNSIIESLAPEKSNAITSRGELSLKHLVEVAAERINTREALIVIDDFDATALAFVRVLGSLQRLLVAGRIVACCHSLPTTTLFARPPHIIRLDGLPTEIAQRVFSRWFERGALQPLATDHLERLTHWLGGHPQLLKLAARCATIIGPEHLIEQIGGSGIPHISHFLTGTLIDHVPEPDRLALAQLALLGTEFGFQLVAALRGSADSASELILSACESLCMTRTGGVYTIHSLVAQGLLERVDEPKRVSLHAGLAAALHALLKAGEPSAAAVLDLIRHAIQGQDAALAQEWAERLIRSLLIHGSLLLCVQLGETLISNIGVPPSFTLLYYIARAHRVMGSYTLALQAYRSAEALALAQEETQKAQFEIGAVLALAGKKAEATGIFVDISRTGVTSVRAHAHLALVRHDKQNAERHLRDARAALAQLPKELETQRLQFHLELTAGLHYLDEDSSGKGAVHLRRAQRLADNLETNYGLAEIEARATMFSRLARLHEVEGDVKGAVSMARKSAELDRAHRGPSDQASSLHLLGRLLCVAEVYDEALLVIEASLRLVRSFGLSSKLPTHETREWLVIALWYNGRIEEGVRAMMDYIRMCELIGEQSAAYVTIERKDLLSLPEPDASGAHILVLPDGVTLNSIGAMQAEIARTDPDLARIGPLMFRRVSGRRGG